MTDFEYRTLRAYANSDLIELTNHKLQITNNAISPVSARFGTTFHTLLLETHKPIDWSLHDVKEHAKILGMRDSFNRAWSYWYKEFPVAAQKCEAIVTWICPITGLPCKAKLDMIAEHPDRQKTVFDLKSTSAKDANDFYDCFVKYGYDRQAAYYLDATGGGYNFTFVGVKKTKPYDVFIIDMSQSNERRAMIDNGRKKNAFWLRKAYEESLKPGGWLPSAWSRTAELVTE